MKKALSIVCAAVALSLAITGCSNASAGSSASSQESGASAAASNSAAGPSAPLDVNEEYAQLQEFVNSNGNVVLENLTKEVASLDLLTMAENKEFSALEGYRDRMKAAAEGLPEYNGSSERVARAYAAQKGYATAYYAEFASAATLAASYEIGDKSGIERYTQDLVDCMEKTVYFRNEYVDALRVIVDEYKATNGQ